MSSISWTPLDTKLWLHEIALRLEAYESWLLETQMWCESNEVYDDRMIFALNFLTIMWASYQLSESVTRRQILEIIRSPSADQADDKLVCLNERYGSLYLEKLLAIAVSCQDPFDFD